MGRKRHAEVARRERRRDIACHNFMFSGGRANSKSATHPGTVNPSPGVNPAGSAVNPAGLCNAAVFKRQASSSFPPALPSPPGSRSEDGSGEGEGREYVRLDLVNSSRLCPLPTGFLSIQSTRVSWRPSPPFCARRILTAA